MRSKENVMNIDDKNLQLTDDLLENANGGFTWPDLYASDDCNADRPAGLATTLSPGAR